MSRSRSENINKIKSKPYDILVIGGGVTGACIARDAALRGFSTACIEKNDWAFGTSSRSSKMIHGGIRYLEMFDFKLVFEACRERRQLLLNAPHLVYPQAFTFPIYKGDKNGIFMIESGLVLYDMLALFRNVKNHRMYLRDKALEIEGGLNGDRLKAMGIFFDCSTDDARLTLAFALTALEAGADCANYIEVVNLLKKGDKIDGARVRDMLSGDEFDVEARLVINAAGAWGDRVCELDEPGAPEKLHLTKGSHIMVPRGRAKTENAMPVVSPSDDRMMFLIPRGHFALLGTTDIYYHEDLDRPFATKEEVEYILEAANCALPRANLDKGDIVSTYSGLRPLVMQEGGEDVAASAVSREHRIYEGHSGLLTIAGGKLTTARSMAEEMVDMAARKLLKEHGVRAVTGCRTMNNPILGTPAPDTVARVRALSTKLSFDDDILKGLFKQGTDALQVLAMIDKDASLADRLSPEVPHIKAQVRFAAESEMAYTIDDFLVRRTEIYYTAPDQGLTVAPIVADLMAEARGWDDNEKARQLDAYRETVALSRRYLE
ncbi:MAG TPA: glycerol-3-phosphate dehydrogenase/oxidase [Candidatus Anoxymicrobiaceae bacterium]